MRTETATRAAWAVGVAETLRAGGLSVTPERCVWFARALEMPGGTDPGRLYWSARISFASSPEDVRRFDEIWSGQSPRQPSPRESPVPPEAGIESAPRDTAERAQPRDFALRMRRAQAGERAETPPDGNARRADASPAEVLAERDLARLTSEELARVRRWLARLLQTPPARVGRRTRRASRGTLVDGRRTLRRSRGSGGEPIRLARRRRRLRPRTLVFLCDVSGSMEVYARAYFALLQSAVRGGAEAFAFATRLTRVTRALRRGSAEGALQRAARAAPDWSGGTRIGEALRRFNRDHGRRGLAHGAVVVIFSDGWERHDPELVESEMRTLSRLAHRIVWVNPHKSGPGFQPRAAGMAAALPYCDSLVGGHSYQALERLVRQLAEIGTGRVAWN
ncbi:MAG: VWA domain-containing protein [Proteobacteria bacterium]|nr:VWA domain-containing protein [Pseudomonadota bacterium]